MKDVAGDLATAVVSLFMEHPGERAATLNAMVDHLVIDASYKEADAQAVKQALLDMVKAVVEGDSDSGHTESECPEPTAHRDFGCPVHHGPVGRGS